MATKFGFKIGGSGMDSSRENVRKVCEASLKRLGMDCIDLFYQHRVDPNTPIEETMQELKVWAKEFSVHISAL